MPNFKSIFRVVDSGAGQAATGENQGDVTERIRSDVESNDVLIYMKGTREFPQCGFSAATIEAFNALGVPYATRDVLEDPELRQGVKDFSNWPTIPQVYVGGKFIGGCDIVTDLSNRGELAGVVQENLPK
ncbi:MAG: Grx4 family monothiol glutaredoxin [SAR324 cluster bacterium]|nr:Grx4 family monothiol glutaredoxin [SAR324 cluster bacterium]